MMLQKRLYMMNCLQKLMLFMLLILASYLQKLTTTQKLKILKAKFLLMNC